MSLITNKTILKQVHDNTHSVGRILRNIELIKKEDVDYSVIENRLKSIETAARECRNQIDIIVNEIKNENEKYSPLTDK